ncbi:bifunctional acetate--CoA ligase family protein/GNAT family N-acetyltransferase [Marinivivus vitaminiproducens]|uniref:bifunctional acetate--CoA ligase family protein/GNAT family N-acetyltransferase n=1 Tax=Marinivivus vitaminiproducens TaxID=3035935 RepID=UPI0027A20BC1|nr:GNAT family N-acetyltransferase [Geminicoccaceae bacterium SCSIO 64248]
MASLTLKQSSLESVFRPRSIALVADDVSPGSAGDLLAGNLIAGGFPGPILPVHPSVQAVRGILAYATVEALPLAPELAVVAGAQVRLPAVVDALGRRGTKATLLVGTRGDAAGLPGTNALLEAARPHGLRLVGPNALGVFSPRHGLAAGLSHRLPLAGDIAFVSQSGTMLTAVLDAATSHGIGFSHLVALGNRIDLDVAEALDFLGQDGRTRAVLLYLEDIGDVRRFLSAARATARAKPVLVLRARMARSGAFAAGTPDRDATGTGSSDAVFDAAFRRAGLLRVPGLDALFEAVETLGMGLRVTGERLTIVSNGGGLGLLAADLLLEQGGQLAELSADTLRQLDAIAPGGWRRTNPIDLGGHADGPTYRQAIETVLEDKQAGTLLVVHGPSAEADPIAVADATLEALGRRARPLLTSWLGKATLGTVRARFGRHRIPCFETPQQAVAAFMHLVRYERNQRLLQRVPPSVSDLLATDADRARSLMAAALPSEGEADLDPKAAQDVLAAYGLTVAVDAHPRSGVRPLALRVREDLVFGSVIELRHGGQAASRGEIPGIALPPLDLILARDLLDTVGLDDPSDRAHEAMTVALLQVAQMIVDQHMLAAVELDPIVVDGGRVRIGGARLRVRASGRRRLAIRPYPKQLETSARMEDGTEAAIRPIRPEDAPAIEAMIARTTGNDLRLRFFASIASLSSAMIARLTQIDYDREMALVAILPENDTDTIGGVVRISADPDNRRAEYAVLLRSDLKGKGLGRALMRLILSYADERGIQEVYGEVLRENRAMLALSSELGFTRHRSEEDPDILEVRWRRPSP